MQDLETLLNDHLKDLEHLDQVYQITRQTRRHGFLPHEDRMEEFFLGYWEIGMAICKEPDFVGSPLLENYLNKSTPILKASQAYAEGYIEQIEREISTDREQGLYGFIPRDKFWPSWCKRRSAIAFFDALYVLHLLDYLDDYFYKAQLDMVLEKVAQEHGGLNAKEIPGETPHSHWWWWAPDKPSQSQA